MTELEIFLATALHQILDLHDNPVQTCDCRQCTIARQSLAAAKLSDLMSDAENAKAMQLAAEENRNTFCQVSQ